MKKTTLKIDGMYCSMCEAHINDVIRNNFKVNKVNSSHTKGLTEIISEGSLNEKDVREAIAKTGYKVEDYHEEEYVKKGFSLFR